MGKTKTSGRRGFSFERIPATKLRNTAKIVNHNVSQTLGDVELVSEALIQALKDGDAEAFKKILSAHLSVTSKERFSKRAQIPRRTLFRMLSPQGNPSLENVARIVHALTKTT